MILRIFICLMVASNVTPEIIVHDRVMNGTIEEIYDLSSTFGPSIPQNGIKGVLHEASPLLGCRPLTPPPPLPTYIPPSTRHWIALIRRGNCTFATKVLHGQAAGYSAVIVMDDESDYIQPMSAAADTADNVSIPSVIVGLTDGAALLNYFKNYRRFSVKITDYEPIDIEKYLLPFVVTVGVCFVAMLCFMLVKCVKDYRKSRKHRLSWRELRRLPLHTYNSATDEQVYECCAICLEDYVNGDKLRLLPCRHGYHSRCIDPWLTKRRRVCPVCKAKVRLGGGAANSAPHSDSDDSDAEAPSANERAPLLQQAAQQSAGSNHLHRPSATTTTTASTSSGTFAPVAENPFQRAARLAKSIRQGYTSLGGEDEDLIENEGATATEEERTPAVMLPGSDDELNDQLEVVTVTRRKKRKRTRKRDSPNGAGSSSNRRGKSQSTNVSVDNEAPVHAPPERHTRTPSPRDSPGGTEPPRPAAPDVTPESNTPSPHETSAGTGAAPERAQASRQPDDSNEDEQKNSTELKV